MLGERIGRHKSSCWLVNTGWTGGSYGVGERINLSYTRAMVNAAVEGKLEGVPAKPHPVFHVSVPENVPGVPPEVLDPRRMWQDKDAYDRAALELSNRFHENFKRFSGSMGGVVSAAPGK
jgi:phosphoenolpyruvate carboxykinase (ATP)